MIRKIFFTAITLLIAFYASAQEYNTPSTKNDKQTEPYIIDNPYFEYGYDSSSGFETELARVVVGDDFTLIIIHVIVLPKCIGCWVALDHNTKLSYDGQNGIKIDDWGVYDIDGNPITLRFDEHYNVKKDKRYTFFLSFQHGIKKGVDKINVVEPEGWYWKGIHIHNSSKASLETRHESKTNIGTIGRDNTIEHDFNVTNTGTCFVISSFGHLATCYHVIEGAQRIRVRGINDDFSKAYSARILISDKKNDLTIMIIDDSTFFDTLPTPPYSIETKQTDVGEDVFALGYPLKALMGDEIKLAKGIISSRTGFQGDATSYQLTAAVYPGNSGGPLFNDNGNVIGIINARLLENATYAIKTMYLHNLIQSIDNVNLPTTNKIRNMSLPEKVKELRHFVYIVEVEN